MGTVYGIYAVEYDANDNIVVLEQETVNNTYYGTYEDLLQDITKLYECAQKKDIVDGDAVKYKALEQTG